jgi:hypothetical protein
MLSTSWTISASLNGLRIKPVSLDVPAHTRLGYGTHDDAGNVAVRLGFPHCMEKSGAVEEPHMRTAVTGNKVFPDRLLQTLTDR